MDQTAAERLLKRLLEDDEVIEAQIIQTTPGTYKVAVTFIDVYDIGTKAGDIKLQRLHRSTLAREKRTLDEDVSTHSWGYVIDHEGYWDLLQAIKSFSRDGAIAEDNEVKPQRRGRPKKQAA
ncbi:hypothetical protein [Ktedonobacter racemifer]|nr:hypothetical protein [Ktedonobacter racemifer]